MPGRKEAKHLLKIADTAGEKAIIEQRYVVNAGPAASMLIFSFPRRRILSLRVTVVHTLCYSKFGPPFE